jgi:hypothetical protein
LLSAALVCCFRSGAQTGVFSSGSTGVDGALNITAPGVTYFKPAAMGLTSGTNIFNFTTINIAAGSTLKFSESTFHGAAYLLASGAVTIAGTIDISGDNSAAPTPYGAESLGYAGSGGYSGGLGGIVGDPNHQALPGNGPGGGAAGNYTGNPSPGGGQFGTNGFLVPLVGGCGGGGTNYSGEFGQQGGSGGGALLIASSTTITLAANNSGLGNIYAVGGNSNLVFGCAGAGGAVRLIANSITANGAAGISVNSGNSAGCPTPSGAGLARIESYNTSGSLNVNGPSIFSLPFALNLPTTPTPVVTVSSINGVAINANPFSSPDIAINTGSAVPVVITATNVPTASTVTLYILSDTQANQSIPVTLAGTIQSSTATVNVTFPSGGSRGFVKAVFH